MEQLAMRGLAALEGEGHDVGLGKVCVGGGAEHLGERGPRSSGRAFVAQEEAIRDSRRNPDACLPGVLRGAS